MLRALVLMTLLLPPLLASASEPERVAVVPSDNLFSGDSARPLPTASRALLPHLGALLRSRSEVVVAVHTDSDGTSADNLALSVKRAERIKALLRTLGVPAYRLRLLGYGDTSPVDRSGTRDAARKNRRVELWLSAE